MTFTNRKSTCKTTSKCGIWNHVINVKNVLDLGFKGLMVLWQVLPLVFSVLWMKWVHSHRYTNGVLWLTQIPYEIVSKGSRMCQLSSQIIYYFCVFEGQFQILTLLPLFLYFLFTSALEISCPKLYLYKQYLLVFLSPPFKLNGCQGDAFGRCVWLDQRRSLLVSSNCGPASFLPAYLQQRFNGDFELWPVKGPRFHTSVSPRYCISNNCPVFRSLCCIF
jgi:hypothetical protein